MEKNLTDTQLDILENLRKGTEETKNRVPMVSLSTIENMLMKKYSICQILKNGKGNGTGFFCKLKIGEKKIKVLLTNNHVFNLEENK